MKNIFFLFLLVLITFQSKANDDVFDKNVEISTLLKHNYTITKKFIPQPFDGFIYFVLQKEKFVDYDKKLSTNELSVIVDNLSVNKRNPAIRNYQEMIFKGGSLIICKVSFEKTSCIKP